MLVVTKEGTVCIARQWQDSAAPGPFLRLYKNNVMPDHTFTIASFLENTFLGYAAQPMGAPTLISGQPDGSCLLVWPTLTFSASVPSTEQSFGYFVVDIDPVLLTPVLVWCEAKTPVVSWITPGQSLSIQPQLNLSTLFG